MNAAVGPLGRSFNTLKFYLIKTYETATNYTLVILLQHWGGSKVRNILFKLMPKVCVTLSLSKISEVHETPQFE